MLALTAIIFINNLKDSTIETDRIIVVCDVLRQCSQMIDDAHDFLSGQYHRRPVSVSDVSFDDDGYLVLPFERKEGYENDHRKVRQDVLPFEYYYHRPDTRLFIHLGPSLFCRVWYYCSLSPAVYSSRMSPRIILMTLM